jgi:hypothetical protein
MIYSEFTDERGTTWIHGLNDDGRISWIPLDPANSDYQAYLASLEAENN